MSAETRGRASGIVQADLTLICQAARARPETAIPSAIAEVAHRLLGHRLMTVMRFYRETMELERIFSSQPVAYPLGGRKAKRGLVWAERVLMRGEVFFGNGPRDLEWAFDDHLKLVALGLGSVINTPIVLNGRCLGTFNLLHQSDWYRPDDEQLTKILAYLLVPALLCAGEMRCS